VTVDHVILITIKNSRFVRGYLFSNKHLPFYSRAFTTLKGITKVLLPPVSKMFSHSIRFKTYNNAIRVAIELYLIKAKTTDLPDKLPIGLPKDLFSGKDFEYEKTADGFVISPI